MEIFYFLNGCGVKRFERRFLNSKKTGMTIEDFERDHLRNTVHAYYLCQDVTQARFLDYQNKAVELGDTPEGDKATMSAGFLVGINDGIHDPNYEFAIFDDLDKQQRDAWGFLIGDTEGNIVGAVETLNEYAKVRNLKPKDILERFPRCEFEAEFAAFEQKQSEKGA